MFQSFVPKEYAIYKLLLNSKLIVREIEAICNQGKNIWRADKKKR